MATYLNVNKITAGSEDDLITGTDGDDQLRGSQGNDFIIAGAGDDFLRGGAGNDVLWGGAGRDRLEGAAGNDDLRGGKGNDLLFGGNGNDILSGDIGADTLYGGAGDDLFYFSRRTAGLDDDGSAAFDTIADFGGGDVIRFGGYGKKAALLFEQDGTTTNIYVDMNGDGVAEYLAAAVLNANLDDVQAATSFGGIVL